MANLTEPQTAGVLNRDDVWQAFAGDAERVRQLIALVVSDAPRYACALIENVRAGDWPAVEEMAHVIKGAVGNVSATRVRAVAASIEDRARARDTASLPALCAVLEAATAELVRDLEMWAWELEDGADRGPRKEEVSRPVDEPPRILAVDDDAATRLTLEGIISASGWRPVVASSGAEAFDLLTAPDAPRIALVDWKMPGLSGIDLCRKLRLEAARLNPYVIFVTAKATAADIVHGLDAGGDDYMVKPIVAAELQSRVRVGLRTLMMQAHLTARIRELETAKAQIHQLEALLPMCSYCRRIRDDADYWQGLEEYICRHSAVRFTHGFCPNCYQTRVLPDFGLKD